jgi:hypothetical protein
MTDFIIYTLTQLDAHAAVLVAVVWINQLILSRNY